MPMAHPPGGGSPATAMSPPTLTSDPEPESVRDVGGGPVGEKGLGGGAEVEANTLRNPRRLPFAVEVEVPESRDRTEVSQLKRARLDPIDVAVIAERLHGSADRRVDGTVGSFGHRIGDVESFEEQRRNLDGAPRVGMEVRQLRIGAKATAGTVDGLSLGAQNPLRFVCARRVVPRQRWPWCPRHGRTASPCRIAPMPLSLWSPPRRGARGGDRRSCRRGGWQGRGGRRQGRGGRRWRR